MNKTQIKQTLRDCQFDPNEPGPIKVISEVGNCAYYLVRAKEILSQEPMTIKVSDIKLCIQLLILCLVTKAFGITKPKKPRYKSKEKKLVVSFHESDGGVPCIKPSLPLDAE